MTCRLFPLLVIVAGLALGGRLGGLWGNLIAVAEARRAGEFVRMTDVNAPTGEDESPFLEVAAGDGATELASEQDAPASSGDNSGEAELDILYLTDPEISLLQSLTARRLEIERRGRQVVEREGLLSAVEVRINAKIAHLEELKELIEKRLAEYDSHTEAQYASLVKIYENMKPKKAGRIFEELEMEVLLPVVERMRERKVAPILEKMDPTKAKSITYELAARRELPLARE